MSPKDKAEVLREVADCCGDVDLNSDGATTAGEIMAALEERAHDLDEQDEDQEKVSKVFADCVDDMVMRHTKGMAPWAGEPHPPEDTAIIAQREYRRLVDENSYKVGKIAKLEKELAIHKCPPGFAQYNISYVAGLQAKADDLRADNDNVRGQRDIHRERADRLAKQVENQVNTIGTFQASESSANKALANAKDEIDNLQAQVAMVVRERNQAEGLTKTVCDANEELSLEIAQLKRKCRYCPNGF